MAIRKYQHYLESNASKKLHIVEKSEADSLKLYTIRGRGDWDDQIFGDPPIHKIGGPIKPKAAITPPPWPDFELGGLCDDWSLNPNRCRRMSQVDTGDGLLCLACRDRREGWI